MSKLTKNRKIATEKLKKFKEKGNCSINEAICLVKEIASENFDASVDLAIRLNVDAKKSDQMVRGSVSLPHGTGKKKTVLALVTPDKEEEAKSAGADYVGLDEYLQKIKSGWTDVDVIITIPSIMPKLGPLAKTLGPRGLMPNPKTGTVTPNIRKAIADVKAGKIDFKMDKSGVVHASIGRVSFSEEKISENVQEFLNSLSKVKPSAVKGNYIKSAYLSSTMGLGVYIDEKFV